MKTLIPGILTLSGSKEANITVNSSSSTSATFTYTYDGTEAVMNYILNFEVSVVGDYALTWTIGTLRGSPEMRSCYVLVKTNSPITSYDSMYNSDILCYSVSYTGHEKTLTNTAISDLFYVGFYDEALSEGTGSIVYTVSIAKVDKEENDPPTTTADSSPASANWNEKGSGYSTYSNYNTIVYNTKYSVNTSDQKTEPIWEIGDGLITPLISEEKMSKNWRLYSFTLPAGEYKISLTRSAINTSARRKNANFVGLFKKSDIIPESGGGHHQLLSFTYSDKDKALLYINYNGSTGGTLASYKDPNNFDCVNVTSTGEVYTLMYYQSYYSSGTAGTNALFSNSVANLTCAAYISKIYVHNVLKEDSNAQYQPSNVPFSVSSSSLTITDSNNTIKSEINTGYKIKVPNISGADSGLSISISKVDQKKLSEIVSYTLSGETKNYANTAKFSTTHNNTAFKVSTKPLAYIYKGGKLVAIRDMYVVDSSKNLADTTADKFDEIKNNMSYIGDA